MAEKTDFTTIDVGKCSDKEFPGGGAPAGRDELRVAIGRRAYDEVRKHAAEDNEREICGVLLGDLCRDKEGPYLHVTEIIRGEHTASQGAQVTITHETWNHFHREKDNRFPDKQYLGWYHSHPDFGIFLSAMDVFIHENFFSAPHQVALVVDPLRDEEGLYFWKAGKTERAGRFWVGREEHKYEPAPEPSPEEKRLVELEKKIDRLRAQLSETDAAFRERPEGNLLQTMLLLGILLFLAVQAFTGYFRGREKQLIDAEEAFRRAVFKVDLDPSKGVVDMRLRLPSEARPVETKFNPVTGETETLYRLDIVDMARRYLQQGEVRSDGSGDSGALAPWTKAGEKPPEGPGGGGASTSAPRSDKQTGGSP